MESIKSVLMKRDGIDEDQADQLIADAKEDLDDLLSIGDLDSAERICEDWFGLEPDYLDQLY